MRKWQGTQENAHWLVVVVEWLGRVVAVTYAVVLALAVVALVVQLAGCSAVLSVLVIDSEGENIEKVQTQSWTHAFDHPEHGWSLSNCELRGIAGGHHTASYTCVDKGVPPGCSGVSSGDGSHTSLLCADAPSLEHGAR